jgi:hypothetical protein
LGFGNTVETALKSIYGAFNAGAVERPLIASPDFSDIVIHSHSNVYGRTSSRIPDIDVKVGA